MTNKYCTASYKLFSATLINRYVLTYCVLISYLLCSRASLVVAAMWLTGGKHVYKLVCMCVCICFRGCVCVHNVRTVG